jgi:LSD1 subclass zinc finger protein
MCPGCRKPLQLPDDAAGKTVRCPLCQAVFAIQPPRPAAAPPPASPPRPVPAAAPGPAAARPSRRAEVEEDEPRRRPPKREAEDRPREKDAPAVYLVLGVGHDPDREMKGDYVGELTGTGLRLRQGDDRIRLKTGAPAKHRRRNQIELKIDGRPVQFLVKGFAQGDGPPLPAQLGGLRVNRHRLAADLAAFLSGDRDESLKVADYLLPWYLFAVAALPLGIPIFTLGGLVPILGAILLCAATFAVVQRDRWPIALRMAAALGVSVFGYGLVIGIVAVIAYASGPTFGGADKPTLPEKSWQAYKSPDGDFEALLPGTPEVLKEPTPGVRLKIDRPDIIFRVHYFRVEPAKRLDLSDPLVANEAPKVWPEMLAPILRDYPESKSPDYGGGVWVGQQLPHSYLVVDSTPKRTHRVETRIQYDRFGDRVYCASVSTPHAGMMDHDVDKFFKSVHVTYQPK